MEKQPTIKILVGYHKPATLLKSDILVPIHLGRAISDQISKDGYLSEEDYQWLFNNTVGDDTGDNISNQNRCYCELTGLYWAWKHYSELGNPDYIGFMHYKRHFNFKAKLREYVEKRYFYTGVITDRYFNNAGIEDIHIKKRVCEFDAIFPCPVKLQSSVATAFYSLATDLDLNYGIFDLFIEEAKRTNPYLTISIENYLRGKYEIPCNMFIMKKQLFFNYMEMLFEVLFRLNAEINYKNMSVNGRRILAYAAEKFLAAYAIFIQQAKMYKVGYLPISKTADTENNSDNLKLDIHNDDSTVTVVYATDDKYAPYTAVSIQSLVLNFSKDRKLEVIILVDNVSKENKRRLLLIQQGYINILIKFFDVTNLGKAQQFYIHGHFSRTAYFRAYIPQILTRHKKVCYLDGDTIILGDIARLYDTTKLTKNQYIAAVPAINPIHAAIRGNMLKVKNMSLIDYWKNILKIGDPLCYFNTGVMVLDLEKMRTENFIQSFNTKVQEIAEPPGVDQDIFNAICNNHATMISQEWNMMGYGDVKNFDKWLPAYLAEDFFRAKEHPQIIHFASAKKPWKSPNIENANEFWKYAKYTSFYDLILISTINDINGNNNPPRIPSTESKKQQRDKHSSWLINLISRHP